MVTDLLKTKLWVDQISPLLPRIILCTHQGNYLSYSLWGMTLRWIYSEFSFNIYSIQSSTHALLNWRSVQLQPTNCHVRWRNLSKSRVRKKKSRRKVPLFLRYRNSLSTANSRSGRHSVKNSAAGDVSLDWPRAYRHRRRGICGPCRRQSGDWRARAARGRTG